MVEGDGIRRDPEHRGEQPLVTDGHVAEPDRAVTRVQQCPGDNADRVGEVDDPCVLLSPFPDPGGHIEHDRHGAQRLGETARAGGLLADAAAFQWPGFVPVPGCLPADAQLQQHRAGPVHGRVQVGSPGHGGRMPVTGHDPR